MSCSGQFLLFSFFFLSLFFIHWYTSQDCCCYGSDHALSGRYPSKSNGNMTAVPLGRAPPLMNFHLLIGNALSSALALVKTEIKMYLSLIKRIHVARFALWVRPVLRITCGHENLTDPGSDIKHSLCADLWSPPRGFVWPDGLFKISISSVDGVVSTAKWSDTISVKANNGFDTGGEADTDLNFNRAGCKTFAWPFPQRMDESRAHKEKAHMEISSSSSSSF